MDNRLLHTDPVYLDYLREKKEVENHTYSEFVKLVKRAKSIVCIVNVSHGMYVECKIAKAELLRKLESSVSSWGEDECGHFIGWLDENDVLIVGE